MPRSLATAFDLPPTVEIRPAGEDDWSFVLDSWIKSYSFSKFAQIRGSKYLDEQERIARWCIGRGTLLVAHYEGDPEVILGWVCGRREPATVDYIYCKFNARRMGIARLLLNRLLGGDYRNARPRLTHKAHTKLRQKIEGCGGVFAPVSTEEMAQ